MRIEDLIGFGIPTNDTEASIVVMETRTVPERPTGGSPANHTAVSVHHAEFVVGHTFADLLPRDDRRLPASLIERDFRHTIPVPWQGVEQRAGGGLIQAGRLIAEGQQSPAVPGDGEPDAAVKSGRDGAQHLARRHLHHADIAVQVRQGKLARMARHGLHIGGLSKPLTTKRPCEASRFADR